MGFFSELGHVAQIMQLPPKFKGLTFYSEGKNYWPHLKGLISTLLECPDVAICYISSGVDDPGLALEHANYCAFEIGQGFIRNWLFENIDTRVMVLTMPDLHQYQLKRSKHGVHYVYVQHSLVSLHRAYRPGAFDHYDSIFCAGPHHVAEIKALEKYAGLPPKRLVELGYSRLDSIIQTAAGQSKNAQKLGQPLHFLLAPSWGPNCLIESGYAAVLIDSLLSLGHRVTLRPHPQSLTLAADQIDEIVNRLHHQPLFAFEAHVDGQQSLHDSDMMISDWSGAALEYGFGLNKPVIFVDLPAKVNNPNHQVIDIEPFEQKVRDQIGEVIGLDQLDVNSVAAVIKRIEAKLIPCHDIYNVGHSDRIGSEYIRSILNIGK